MTGKNNKKQILYLGAISMLIYSMQGSFSNHRTGDSSLNVNVPSTVLNEVVVDMYEAGIIDPAKVTRIALEKAASVAGTMLITECVLTEIPSDDKAPSNPMTGMGMM